MNSGAELKVNEDEDPPFKDKVIGTCKLQEENQKETASPKKKEFLRMQSQIALPVMKNE